MAFRLIAKTHLNKLKHQSVKYRNSQLHTGCGFGNNCRCLPVKREFKNKRKLFEIAVVGGNVNLNMIYWYIDK